MKRTTLSGTVMIAITVAWAGYAPAQEGKPQAGKEAVAQQKSQGSRAAPVLYTCPAHPAVRATWAGTCPDCGQALSKPRKAAPATSAGCACPWWTSGQPKKAKGQVQYQGCGHCYGGQVLSRPEKARPAASACCACPWWTSGQPKKAKGQVQYQGCGSCW